MNAQDLVIFGVIQVRDDHVGRLLEAHRITEPEAIQALAVWSDRTMQPTPPT